MAATHTAQQLFSSDIDGTLLGNLEAAQAFKLTWQAMPEAARPYLCYNTGRLLDDALDLVKDRVLPTPDYLICGVGTQIYDCRKQTALHSFEQRLETGWDLALVEHTVTTGFPAARKQPTHFQTRFKSSWYLSDLKEADTVRLENALERAGLEINVVYSSNRDLDILPRYADKGNALKWLLQHLQLTAAQAVVAGDTGNDAAMMLLRGIRAILVGNAQPELLEATVGKGVYRAEACFADGVLEGLLHYGVIPAIVRPQGRTDSHVLQAGENDALQHFIEEEPLPPISGADLDFLRLAYGKAVEGLRRTITPMGFAACSLADNDTRGTDENYRSVWGRDGSITTLGALRLRDPEFTECAKRTLCTLLDHVSPTGQIPANVSIDTALPDYSGVGGICSIDSGLWLIIAVHEYVERTKDLDFLRHYIDVLQHVMNWLSAHDSNNDALLEIPEAGDWTDLFGRSYNVLYDEVLWYRANVCFARLVERLGRLQQAADYLRWSSTIKSALLHKFWPSSRGSVHGNYSFADKQTSLGDTNYLIAQVTPFDFDWRCDVYGNILALLFNVMDIDSAKIAFRYMWGTGVNEPFPVANLYPVVQAGDPTWRQYYVVNLLNLPHHYHNGGLWPFIGAQWVRFIHRLGLRDVALGELLKLARLNQTGIRFEWEFNEWAHGKTGKPMGKAFQAWSCSEFIQACHDLRIVQ